MSLLCVHTIIVPLLSGGLEHTQVKICIFGQPEEQGTRQQLLTWGASYADMYPFLWCHCEGQHPGVRGIQGMGGLRYLLQLSRETSTRPCRQFF